MAKTSASLQLPLGAGPRPVSPAVGQIRLNTTTSDIETYDGTQWVVTVGGLGSKLEITIGKEKFGECEYWVEVVPGGLFSDRRQKNIEIDEWVVATYGPKSDWGYGRWCAADGRYWFKKEADRDWFVVKWSA